MRIIAERILRHTAIIGASGSGKTVLAKQVLEDATLKGIPSISYDTQGDIAALSLGGKELLGKWIGKRTRLIVLGLSHSVSPFTLEKSRWASAIASRLNCVDVESVAAIRAYLAYSDCQTWEQLLADRTHFDKDCVTGEYAAGAKLSKIQRALARLELDSESLSLPSLCLQKAMAHKGPTVICAWHLPIPEQQSLLAFVADATYNAMLQSKSKNALRAILFVDEIAPFLPPIRNPPSKDGLLMLARQARKYGVGLIVATQSIGDVDYKALANFSTLAMGKLVSNQDLHKARKILQSRGRERLTQSLPRQPTGQFYSLYGTELDVVKTRWLHTQHKPLSIEQAAEKTDV